MRGLLDGEADRVLARLDDVPQTLCHHDFHPGNVVGADASVVVDWAYCGLAAVGLDAGVLVADGLADGAFPPVLADAVDCAVRAGYAAGLADGGWAGREDDVWLAYLRGTALRLSWLRRASERLATEDPRREAWSAAVDLLDGWRAEARRLPSAA